MLFNAFKTAGTLFFFLLSVFSFQAQAENNSTHEYRRPPSELPDDISKLKPTVLLCFVRSEEKEYKEPNTPEECKEYIGHVVKAASGNAGTHICRYQVNGTARESYDFEWLDAGFYEQHGFMDFHAQKVTLPDSQNYYFALRKPERQAESSEPICALVDVNADQKKATISYGYEQLIDGNLTCGKLDTVEAIYHHTYERINCKQPPNTPEASPLLSTTAMLGGAPGSCPPGAVTTECHNCNGNGCGAFKCSGFTHWDDCPSGYKLCGSEKCVGGLCDDKPWCTPDSTPKDEM